jgi:hypothetical protein
MVRKVTINESEDVMTFFKSLNHLRMSLFPAKISFCRSQLIRASALLKYRHFDEALKEAETSRDSQYATALDVLYAKAKMIEILNAKSKYEKTDGMSPKPK